MSRIPYHTVEDAPTAIEGPYARPPTGAEPTSPALPSGEPANRYRPETGPTIHQGHQLYVRLNEGIQLPGPVIDT